MLRRLPSDNGTRFLNYDLKVFSDSKYLSIFMPCFLNCVRDCSEYDIHTVNYVRDSKNMIMALSLIGNLLDHIIMLHFLNHYLF